MKIIIYNLRKILTTEIDNEKKIVPLYSKEAFELISHQWRKVGWNQKYSYTLTWLGRPIIQLPEDMVRIQEVIYQVKLDVIIETGIAHGGSLIYYASSFEVMKKGRIIGIDIEIRSHNRKAIESHELFSRITLIEMSSTSPETIRQVKDLVKSGKTVLVILDSCHTKQHVLDELESYLDLITPGSYIVATDGIMKFLHDVPRGKPEWALDNPVEAVNDFVKRHPEFVLEQPTWLFNESELTKNVTHWPCAFLKKR